MSDCKCPVQTDCCHKLSSEKLEDELKLATAALRSLRGSAMGQDDGWIIDAVDEALAALEKDNV